MDPIQMASSEPSCSRFTLFSEKGIIIIEPGHEISINVVCETSKASDQPEHTHSLIRAFASRLNIL